MGLEVSNHDVARPRPLRPKGLLPTILRTGATFAEDTSGSYLVLTALLTPVVLVGLGVTADMGRLIMHHSAAVQAAHAACQRAVKPTRTLTPNPTRRQQSVLVMFDQLAAQQGLEVTERAATVDWINVDLKASLRFETMFAPLVGVDEIAYKIEENCVGIPPYPHDGEVILSTNFTKPNGDAVPLSQSYDRPNCWDIFRAQEFGWDLGTGPGVEIQDWRPGCFNSVGRLPQADFPSTYVVELDSYANSSITKTVELHPGRYRISNWYHGRINDVTSNGIGVYIKQIEPRIGPELRLFSMAQNGSAGWRYYQTEVTVERYSIYNLSIRAEGKSDTYGGLINAFNVQFIDTFE